MIMSREEPFRKTWFTLLHLQVTQLPPAGARLYDWMGKPDLCGYGSVLEKMSE